MLTEYAARFRYSSTRRRQEHLRMRRSLRSFNEMNHEQRKEFFKHLVAQYSIRCTHCRTEGPPLTSATVASPDAPQLKIYPTSLNLEVVATKAILHQEVKRLSVHFFSLVRCLAGKSIIPLLPAPLTQSVHPLSRVYFSPGSMAAS